MTEDEKVVDKEQVDALLKMMRKMQSTLEEQGKIIQEQSSTIGKLEQERTDRAESRRQDIAQVQAQPYKKPVPIRDTGEQSPRVRKPKKFDISKFDAATLWCKAREKGLDSDHGVTITRDEELKKFLEDDED
jgi:hypothetical protein